MQGRDLIGIPFMLYNSIFQPVYLDPTRIYSVLVFVLRLASLEKYLTKTRDNFPQITILHVSGKANWKVKDEEAALVTKMLRSRTQLNCRSAQIRFKLLRLSTLFAGMRLRCQYRSHGSSLFIHMRRIYRIFMVCILLYCRYLHF